MLKPKQFGHVYGYGKNDEGVKSVHHSAEVIVPLLIDRFHPQRVLDLGCGVGDWLQVFHQNGVNKIAGYDGEWVPREGLKIPTESFSTIDLYGDWPALQPYDLALCLEVAEHVAADIGEKIVSFLTASSGVVLFSAAVPGQGGYEHINEQYQDYWVRAFAAKGFAAFDLIRPVVWMDERVSWWYQQNMLVFAHPSAQQTYSLTTESFMSNVIHPFLYERAKDPRSYSLKQFCKHLPFYITKRLRAH